jgi:hypothetical protein
MGTRSLVDDTSIFGSRSERSLYCSFAAHYRHAESTNKKEWSQNHDTLLMCDLLIELEQVTARICKNESKRNRCQIDSASQEKGGVPAFNSLGCPLRWLYDDRRLRIFVPTNLGYDLLRLHIANAMRVGCASFRRRLFSGRGCRHICFPVLERPPK